MVKFGVTPKPPPSEVAMDVIFWDQTSLHDISMIFIDHLLGAIKKNTEFSYIWLLSRPVDKFSNKNIAEKNEREM